MKIIAEGLSTVKTAPPGSLLLFYNGTLVLKSEYSKEDGTPDCYILGSGEYFCGDIDTRAMIVSIDPQYPEEEE